MGFAGAREPHDGPRADFRHHARGRGFPDLELGAGHSRVSQETGHRLTGWRMSLLERASGLALRYLPQDRLVALREAYLWARTRLHPLMRAAYGTFDASGLREHLEQKIGTDFEILMVHSSVNHMKPMYSD